MPKAIGQITIYDFHDVYSAAIAPTNPVKDMIWLDTSVNPPIMRVYNGSKWVMANDYSSEIAGINKVTTTHTTQINTQQGKIDTLIQDTTIIKNGVSTKLKDEYNKTVDTVNSHTQTIGSHTSTINNLTGEVEAVQTKTAEIISDLSGITQRVSSSESNISTHTTQLGTVDSRINTAKNSAISTASSDATSKANNAQTNAVNSAKSYTDGQITTVNKTITDKVAEIKLTTDSITQRVSSTESKITTVTNTANSALTNANSANSKVDNLQIGGRNLVLNSRCKNFEHWALTNSVNFKSYSENGIQKGFMADGTSNGNHIRTEINKNIEPNTEYTLTYFQKNTSSSNVWIGMYYNGGYVTIVNYDTTTYSEFTKKTFTFKTPPNVTDFNLRIYLYSQTQTIFKDIKIEKGNKATDWTPAPEDVDNAITTVDTKVETASKKVAEIVTNLDSITQRVSSTESNITTVTTTANTAKSTADSAAANASTAVSTANTAKNTASTASTNASAAVSTANTAKTTADSASSVASTAKTTADTAKSTADTAKTTAATASTNAANAVSTANGALTNAKKYTDDQVIVVNQTITNKVAEIKTTTDSITQRVSSSESNISTHTTQLGTVDSRINTAKNDAITGARNIPDTRSKNENPQWYFTNYPKQTITEFKYANIVGIGSASIYGTLETKVPWSEPSGGYPVQIFRSNSTATYERKGTSTTAWGAWLQIEDTTSSQSKANTAQTNAINSAKGYTDGQITVVNKTITDKVAEIKTTTDSITQRVSSTETTVNSHTTQLGAVDGKITGAINTSKSYYDAQILLDKKSLTASFTEMHNAGYEQGITTINKNGVEVSHSNANTRTRMSADGLSILDSNGDVIAWVSNKQQWTEIMADKIFAANIENVYQGADTLYVNHSYTGASDGSSSKPFSSFSDLQNYLSLTPMINTDLYINVIYPGYEITEQLLLHSLKGSGFIKINLDSRITMRNIGHGQYCIRFYQIAKRVWLLGGRSSPTATDGALLVDKTDGGGGHAIYASDVNTLEINLLTMNCVNYGIYVENTDLYTYAVDFGKCYKCVHATRQSLYFSGMDCGSGTYFFQANSGGKGFWGHDGSPVRPNGACSAANGIFYSYGNCAISRSYRFGSGQSKPTAPTTSNYSQNFGWTSRKTYAYQYSNWSDSDCKQGAWGYGLRGGHMFFDITSIRSFLSGTVLDGNTITLTRASSGGLSGAANVYINGSTCSGASGTPGYSNQTLLGTLAWGETKTFTLPKAIVQSLKSGACSSLAVYVNSTAQSNYLNIVNCSITLKVNK